MNIPSSKISVSFEFYPPKTEKGEVSLWKTLKILEKFNPSFVSITCGAGGSKQTKNMKLIKNLSNRKLNVAAHLTCVSACRDQVNNIAMDFINNGASQIVALRGDPPIGAHEYCPHPDGYVNAADLVRGLRNLQTRPIEISVAGYPETHPDSKNETEDIDNLKRKVEAGADRIITQFFFDNELFLKFRDKANASGISIPIIPGIMPIINLSNIIKMGQKVGTSIPQCLKNKFIGTENDKDAQSLISKDIAAKQIQELMNEGVENFHFFTMNQHELTSYVCNQIGINPSVELY